MLHKTRYIFKADANDAAGARKVNIRVEIKASCLALKAWQKFIAVTHTKPHYMTNMGVVYLGIFPTLKVQLASYMVSMHRAREGLLALTILGKDLVACPATG